MDKKFLFNKAPQSYDDYSILNLEIKENRWEKFSIKNKNMFLIIKNDKQAKKYNMQF